MTGWDPQGAGGRGEAAVPQANGWFLAPKEGAIPTKPPPNPLEMGIDSPSHSSPPQTVSICTQPTPQPAPIPLCLVPGAAGT